MRINTFFQFCLYICIALIALNLVIAFVVGLDAFDTEFDLGFQGGDNTSEVFSSYLSGGGLSGMGAVWDAVLTASGVAAIVVAILMHSAIPVGAYIFSGVFWTAYGHSFVVLENLYIPSDFLIIGTVLMLFMWAGAIAGMFSGSG